MSRSVSKRGSAVRVHGWHGAVARHCPSRHSHVSSGHDASSSGGLQVWSGGTTCQVRTRACFVRTHRTVGQVAVQLTSRNTTELVPWRAGSVTSLDHNRRVQPLPVRRQQPRVRRQPPLVRRQPPAVRRQPPPVRRRPPAVRRHRVVRRSPSFRYRGRSDKWWAEGQEQRNPAIRLSALAHTSARLPDRLTI